MNVGMVGLGKLGLPVAYAIASRGFDVYGYDPCVTHAPVDASHEEGLAAAIEQAGSRMRFATLKEVITNCDVVFCAVQTPHEPRFEGTTPLPDDRADFDYRYLRQAISQISDEAKRQDKTVTLAVISTVLPGTMAREIQPLLYGRVELVYNPSFIAMGTTIRDFLDPEFVLMGGPDAFSKVWGLYYELGLKERIYGTSIANAELIKVAYNTFIGLKLAFANTIMEVCHKTPGTDVDAVTGALQIAHRRLISGAYLGGGMGDGGGCHPRDNIALSWLARELDLSHDLFDDLMRCREDQARWLVDLMAEINMEHQINYGILGIAYKPGSHITTGSPARLVESLMQERFMVPCIYDPHVPEHADARCLDQPHLWLVGCKHPEFPSLQLPEGSVVIDPWRYMPDQEGVEVIRIGGRAGVPAVSAV